MKKLFAALPLVVLLMSCSSLIYPAPNGPSGGVAPVASQPDPANALKRSIIATHDGLYIPVITTLGTLYDAHNPQVRAWGPKIQKISEDYIKAKDDADLAVKTLGAGGADKVALAMKTMLAAITDLQQIRSEMGGKP